MKVSQIGSTHSVDVESSGIDNLAFLEQLAASHTIDLDQPLDNGQFSRQVDQGGRSGTTREAHPNALEKSPSNDAGKKCPSNDLTSKDSKGKNNALQKGRVAKLVKASNSTVSESPGSRGSENDGNTSNLNMDKSFNREKKVSPSKIPWFNHNLKERWDIWKNVIVISFAFMFNFTAFQGTANLQSSINAVDGLGTQSLMAVYASLIASCCLVPTLTIRRFTVKWTLTFSLLCYVPYIVAQFYPRNYTLVPAAVIVGLGAAPMWASKATYITQVGGVYAKLTNQSKEAIVVRFFGFFFFAWQTAELWGNLVSSMVFTSGADPQTVNTTVSPEALHTCGAHFCISSATMSNGNLERPPDSEIYLISGIYLLFVLIAVLTVAFFLDPLSKYGEKPRGKDPSEEKSYVQLLVATFVQLRNPYQVLLIPLTVWSGMEQAFIGADFTQAYVSCALGIPKVGYVMMCYGIVNAVCSVVFGLGMKYVGCPLLVALGILLHLSLVVALNFWEPTAVMGLAFFAFSGLWGIGDAIWQTQMSGIYGNLFEENKEAAFSNLRLWESLGFAISYVFSGFMCIRVKLFVMATVLILGAIGYAIVEILNRRRLRRRAAKDTKAAAADASVAAIESGVHPKADDGEIKEAGKKDAAAADGELAASTECDSGDFEGDPVATHF